MTEQLRQSAVFQKRIADFLAQKTPCTKKCPLRFGRRFNGSFRTIYLCADRHGFMIKHWRCVGIENDKCPLHQSLKEEQK